MNMRIIRSLTELEIELEAADAAANRSYRDYVGRLEEFVLDPRSIVGDFPEDPSSHEYLVAQLALYEAVVGREYDIASEETPFDHSTMLAVPFPYSSRCPETVGNYLMTYGHLIKTMALPLQARILEIGSGYGPLTYQLASMGYSVTCVDVSEKLLAYVRARTAGLPGFVETILGDMNDLQLNGSFDAIVFFESFHHCANHVNLLRRLPELLEPGGTLVLAGEPIVPENTPTVPYPWGLRVDGISLWFARRHGWLELGFEDVYLNDLLERLGWSVVQKPPGPVPSMGVWIAKRTVEDSPYSRMLDRAPIETWKAGDVALRSEFMPLSEAGKSNEIKSEGRPGYLLFGPYTQIDSGFFEVRWFGGADPGSRFAVDVACKKGLRIIRSENCEFTGADSTGLLARLRFKVDVPADDFEFRVRLDSQSEMRIDRVELYKY